MTTVTGPRDMNKISTKGGSERAEWRLGGKVRDDAEESERSVTAGILPLGAHRLADHGRWDGCIRGEQRERMGDGEGVGQQDGWPGECCVWVIPSSALAWFLAVKIALPDCVRVG